MSNLILNQSIYDFKPNDIKYIHHNENYCVYKINYDNLDYDFKISVISNIDLEINKIKEKYKIKDEYLNCFKSFVETEDLIFNKFKDLDYKNNLVEYYGINKNCLINENEEYKEINKQIKETYGMEIEENNNKLLFTLSSSENKNKENNNYSILYFKHYEHKNVYQIYQEIDKIKDKKEKLNELLKFISDILIQLFIQVFHIYKKYPNFIFFNLFEIIIHLDQKNILKLNNKTYEFDYELKLNNFETSSIIDDDYNKSIINSDIIYESEKKNYFNMMFNKNGEYEINKDMIKKIQKKDFEELILTFLCNYLLDYKDEYETIKKYFINRKLNFMVDLFDALINSSVVNEKYNINLNVVEASNLYYTYLFYNVSILIYDKLFDIQRVFKDLDLI